MISNRILRILTCISLALLPQPAQAGGIPRKTLQDIKAATVFIKVDFRVVGSPKPSAASGSGFVLLADKDHAYVATNYHVVQPPRNLAGRVQLVAPPTLVFNSGTSKERSLPGEIVAADPIRDLALLRVKPFAGFPKPIPLNAKTELVETMGVIIFGFPFGKFLGDGRNPAVTVGKGSISSLREDKFGRLKHIQLDGDLNPGNSGGPVVDEDGKLVGVAVAKIVGAKRIGLAIPARYLADMLAGNVADVQFMTLKKDNEHVEIRAVAHVVDPFRKIKNVTIDYVLGQSKELARPDENGRFTALPNARQLKLTRDKDMAEGKLVLPLKWGASFTYQTAVVAADGKARHGPPVVQQADLDTISIAGRLTDKEPLYRQKKPYQAHMLEVKAGHSYAIDMLTEEPGLDPFLYLEDSKGKLLASDDDGGGFPNARIVWTSGKTDTDKIIATAFAGLGRYTLRIRNLADTKKTYKISGDGLSLAGVLVPQDPGDSFLLQQTKRRCPSKNYQVRLRSDKTYVIDLVSSEFDCVLRVEDSAGNQLAVDDDGGEGLNSRLQFHPPDTGIFRLIATTLDGRPGHFTLTVKNQQQP